MDKRGFLGNRRDGRDRGSKGKGFWGAMFMGNIFWDGAVGGGGGYRAIHGRSWEDVESSFFTN